MKRALLVFLLPLAALTYSSNASAVLFGDLKDAKCWKEVPLVCDVASPAEFKRSDDQDAAVVVWASVPGYRVKYPKPPFMADICNGISNSVLKIPFLTKKDCETEHPVMIEAFRYDAKAVKNAKNGLKELKRQIKAAGKHLYLGAVWFKAGESNFYKPAEPKAFKIAPFEPANETLSKPNASDNDDED